jgi:SAM-dependent methyltransferase
MRQDDPGSFWNARFGAESTVYGEGPNVFFANQLEALSPGRILLPGDGEGRNAVHAAGQGWSVQSFDASSVGVEKALAHAAKRGVSIAAEVGDAASWEPQEAFDAIALCYLHLPPPLRADFHPRVARWLKPGGTLILEGFGPGQLAFTSGGPKALDMLFTTAMLEADFAGLEVQMCVTEEADLDEGPYHQGRAELTRLVARRPL